MKESTSPGAEVDHARDAKRQKKSMCNTGEPSNGCTQANVFHSKSIATSKLEPRVGELSGKKAPTTPDSCDASDSICAFCQSFALTDVSTRFWMCLALHIFIFGKHYFILAWCCSVSKTFLGLQISLFYLLFAENWAYVALCKWKGGCGRCSNKLQCYPCSQDMH